MPRARRSPPLLTLLALFAPLAAPIALAATVGEGELVPAHVPAGGPPSDTPPAPPGATQLQAIAKLAEDPEPERLDGQTAELIGKHYLVGNEWHLGLFAAPLAALGRGGIYAGVGSDQAYLFIGWLQPDWALLTDYDEWVVALHAVYGAFFTEAKDRKAFYALWTPEGSEAGRSVLGRVLPRTERGKLALRLYKQYRERVRIRLAKVRDGLKRDKVASFLTDDAQYDAVRARVVAGRVVARRVDLRGKKGLAGVGEAARALGLPIRAVYLSNAENYWPFSKQYRDNVKGLPFDDRSLLIRTVSTWNANFDYRYNLQLALEYADWVSRPWVRGYRDFVKMKRPERDEFELFWTKGKPDEQKVQAERERMKQWRKKQKRAKDAARAEK